MTHALWEWCPADTNALERKNQERESRVRQTLQVAVVRLYKLDKSVCTKHMAAEDRISVTYRDMRIEARQSAAAKGKKQRAIRSDYDVSAVH